MKEVAIVGLGPAGFGALNKLANSKFHGTIICIEEGVNLSKKTCQLAEERACINEVPCEIISGVGGCSCSTGAKLSGYPAGSGLAEILGSHKKAKGKLKDSLSTLQSFLPLQEQKTKGDKGEAKETYERMGFSYRHYPVYTFDHIRLATTYQKILADAQASGVSVLLRTKVIDITKIDNSFKLTLQQGTEKSEIESKYLILAVGQSGYEIIKKVNTKHYLSKNEYHLDLGVRLEFPSEVFQDIDENHGDLKLLFKKARTFCICKGGRITPYKNHGIFALEGSLQKDVDSGFTNLAITIRQEKSPKNLETFEEILSNVRRESGGIPVGQPLVEYLNPHAAEVSVQAPTLSVWKHGKIGNCYPPRLAEELKDAVNFFATNLLPRDKWRRVNVFAPELDFRLTFPLAKDFSIAPKLYMAGDCTGRFRGILQAFCSGEICADSIIGDMGVSKQR